LLFVIGQYLPSKHYLRVFQVIYSVCMILTQTPLYILEGVGSMRWNPMGLVIEGVKIISIIVFYLFFVYRKYLSKRLAKNRPEFELALQKIETNQSDAIPLEELEKRWAKILRYTLGTIDNSTLVGFQSATDKLNPVLNDMGSIEKYKGMFPQPQEEPQEEPQEQPQELQQEESQEQQERPQELQQEEAQEPQEQQEETQEQESNPKKNRKKNQGVV